MPGCQLHCSTDLTLILQHWLGSSTINLHVPWSPALVGLRMNAQALVADPGTNAAGAIASNSGGGAIGAF